MNFRITRTPHPWIKQSPLSTLFNVELPLRDIFGVFAIRITSFLWFGLWVMLDRPITCGIDFTVCGVLLILLFCPTLPFHHDDSNGNVFLGYLWNNIGGISGGDDQNGKRKTMHVLHECPPPKIEKQGPNCRKLHSSLINQETLFTLPFSLISEP